VSIALDISENACHGCITSRGGNKVPFKPPEIIRRLKFVSEKEIKKKPNNMTKFILKLKKKKKVFSTDLRISRSRKPISDQMVEPEVTAETYVPQ
jgi:hypothetical protein